MNSNFKVLFVYPNTPLLNPPPVSIGTFASLLKANDIEVKVFDNTFYTNDKDLNSDKSKEENLQVRPFNYNLKDLPIKKSSQAEDLRSLVEDFQPDLIGLSTLEGTWLTAADLLDAIADMQMTIIVGGIFATFAPEIVLHHPAVSMVCIGEGEGPLVDLCQRMKEGRDYKDIMNLWIKGNNGEIVKNNIRKVVDINQIQIPDYSVFHKARFLRPMAGRVYRTVPVETNRGCPYSCTFCNSPTTAKLYRDCGGGVFFRKKTIERIQEELRFLIEKWDAEYVYFLSDTFLSMTDAEFDKFIHIYRDRKITRLNSSHIPLSRMPSSA